MRRILSAAIAVLVAVTAGAAGYASYLGYFGGAVFTVMPAQSPDRDGTVAVFFSGDMGFNTGMGPRIVGRLTRAGIPVVAVNSLTAFAHRRSPTASATLVADAVARALALPGARQVALIGQSFGANIALSGAAGLPPSLRSRIAITELIVPGRTMLFRATPGGVFDTGHDGPALPYARRITAAPVLCISGETEDGSLCPLWRQPNVRSLTLPGDHYLHHDDALVAATLLRTIRATAT